MKLEDLLEWHEREIASARTELLESARKTDLGKVESLSDAFDILSKYGGPCDSVEEMFSRGVQYVFGSSTQDSQSSRGKYAMGSTKAIDVEAS